MGRSPGDSSEGSRADGDSLDAVVVEGGAAGVTRPPPQPLQWNPSVEALLAGWCDQAKAFEWMHTEASARFDRRARRMMITVNVCVALSGVSNLLTGDVEWGYGIKASYIFGTLTVITSLTNMMQDKLGWAQSADYHLRLATAQGAIRRKLEEELSLPPHSRRDCGTFLRYVRTDINAAATQSGGRIPKDLRDACYDRFHAVPEFDLPETCGQLEHTRVYSNPVCRSSPPPPPPTASFSSAFSTYAARAATSGPARSPSKSVRASSSSSRSAHRAATPRSSGRGEGRWGTHQEQSLAVPGPLNDVTPPPSPTGSSPTTRAELVVVQISAP